MDTCAFETLLCLENDDTLYVVHGLPLMMVSSCIASMETLSLCTRRSKSERLARASWCADQVQAHWTNNASLTAHPSFQHSAVYTVPPHDPTCLVAARALAKDDPAL